jgi:hypothetical protein
MGAGQVGTAPIMPTTEQCPTQSRWQSLACARLMPLLPARPLLAQLTVSRSLSIEMGYSTRPPAPSTPVATTRLRSGGFFVALPQHVGSIRHTVEDMTRVRG